LNNKNRNTKIAFIVMASMIVTMGAATLIPVIKQPQANAASLRQHSNLLNNCFRSKECRDSNVDQGTLGNDNSVTGFGDLSDTTTNITSTPNSALPGAKGDPGPQGIAGVNGSNGADGATGAQGPAGPAGSPRTLVVTEREGAFVTAPSGGFGTATAECRVGEIATGGGYIIGAGDVNNRVITTSEALVFNTGWIVQLFNPGPNDSTVKARAECASLVP
jgi:hypothetical protein